MSSDTFSLWLLGILSFSYLGLAQTAHTFIHMLLPHLQWKKTEHLGNDSHWSSQAPEYLVHMTTNSVLPCSSEVPKCLSLLHETVEWRSQGLELFFFFSLICWCWGKKLWLLFSTINFYYFSFSPKAYIFHTYHACYANHTVFLKWENLHFYIQFNICVIVKQRWYD